MAWILRVAVPAVDSEPLSSMLWDFDATGIAELPVGPGGAGEVVEIVAGFDTEAGARTAAAGVATLGDAPATVEPVDPRAWVDAGRRATLEIGGHHLDLMVGGAFGDGHHPTTRLALDLLTAALTSTQAGASVLDVGTGTGILALAARALGASTVAAVDTDPDALDVAGHNLAGHPDLAAGITLTDRFPSDRASPSGGGFGLVVANIVLGTQRELASMIGSAVAPGGLVILSGLLAEQEAAAVALHPDLDPTVRARDGDWVGLALGRPPDGGSVARGRP